MHLKFNLPLYNNNILPYQSVQNIYIKINIKISIFQKHKIIRAKVIDHISSHSNQIHNIYIYIYTH